jgi:hypothetical protein
MTVETYAKPSTRMRRFSPALVTDLPVLVVLVLAWLTVPVFWAHLVTGLALIAIAGMHLSTRRRPPLRGGRARRRVPYALFLVAAAAVAVTGLLRWAGMPPQYVWHGGISYLLLGLVVVHLWSVRRALRARFRPRTRGSRSQQQRTHHE